MQVYTYKSALYVDHWRLFVLEITEVPSKIMPLGHRLLTDAADWRQWAPRRPFFFFFSKHFWLFFIWWWWLRASHVTFISAGAPLSWSNMSAYFNSAGYSITTIASLQRHRQQHTQTLATQRNATRHNTTPPTRFDSIRFDSTKWNEINKRCTVAFQTRIYSDFFSIICLVPTNGVHAIR